MDNLPDGSAWLFAGGAGMLGRLMYHAKQVQAGKRKSFSWVLMWDVPIALGMGWIGYGIAVTLKNVLSFTIPIELIMSIAMVCAYLGPYAIDTIFAKWSDWKFGGKKNG